MEKKLKMNQELIPGLPEEIARECLIRVPFTHVPSIRPVCRLWKHETESELFHRTRKLSNLTRPVIALAHAEPAPFPSGPAHKYHAAATPCIRLVVVDPTAATWHPLPPVPCHRGGGLPLFCQVAAGEREVVVVGGWDPEKWAPLDDVFVYDFTAAAWRRGKPVPGPKRSFFACAGSGRVVYIAGGHDEEKNALKSALAYDVAKDEWVPLPDMTAERDECKGVYLRGRFHVVGGYATEHQGRFGRSGEAFDPATWRWGPLEEEMLDFAACPRTCAAGPEGRLYMVRRGHVAAREAEGGAWREVAEVPEEVGVSPTVVTWKRRVMVVGAGSHGGAQTGYVLEEEEGRRSAWRKVEVPYEFSGHVQAACVLEI